MTLFFSPDPCVRPGAAARSSGQSARSLHLKTRRFTLVPVRPGLFRCFSLLLLNKEAKAGLMYCGKKKHADVHGMGEEQVTEEGQVGEVASTRLL